MAFRIQLESDEPIDEAGLGTDPLAAVGRWIEEARERGQPFPGAATLATVGPEGGADARMIQLHRISAIGLEFHTNYRSVKGRQVDAQPGVALVFYWSLLHRQIRVQGQARRLDADDSDSYWSGRDRQSQLAALASQQSQDLRSREDLERDFEQASIGNPGQVPRPSYWGGYVVVPDVIEFWQGRRNRLHDRVRFDRDGAGGEWRKHRLAP
ncbi:MAG TPA: pyridoxamine 5'-phosphate oxidase [Candidatus Nitrosotalea sp.]|nr:pyridoxamine 5'-phosphate oxidase [Candidatus Nitrosotalea sp.]